MPHEPDWWYRPPGFMAACLQPLAKIYGHVAERRFAAVKPYRSTLPVICVGNFTAGGSGKTPFTAMLVQGLIARGEQPAILTRGYGGRLRGPHWVNVQSDRAEDVGDEPLLLAAFAPVVVCRDRAAGARSIEAHTVPTVIVMDDGLQNLTLVKDLCVAVVDGARGIGNGSVIPAGPLRGLMHSQGARAQLIAFNGSPAAGLAEAMARWCPVPQIEAQLQPARDAAVLAGERVLAFAGIGDPDRFFETLRSLGCVVVETRSFADHASYTPTEAAMLLACAKRLEARLVTTQKDFVRFADHPRLAALAAATTAVSVSMVLTQDDQAALDAVLDVVLTGRGASA